MWMTLDLFHLHVNPVNRRREHAKNRSTRWERLNPLTAGAAYIRVFIFLAH